MSATPEVIMSFSDVAHAIQLALAPVFLLTGIAGLLNVVAGRLARIIDRGRSLTEQSLPQHLEDPDALNKELNRLERRRHYASLAITACTCSALLVCMVVAVIFLQVMLQVEFKWMISFFIYCVNPDVNCRAGVIFCRRCISRRARCESRLSTPAE